MDAGTSLGPLILVLPMSRLQVYHAVPTLEFLQQAPVSEDPVLFGLPLSDRIGANVTEGDLEMRRVLLRLGGFITAEEFREGLAQVMPDPHLAAQVRALPLAIRRIEVPLRSSRQGPSASRAELIGALIQLEAAIERRLGSGKSKLPTCVDLFLRQALPAVSIQASVRRLRRLAGSPKNPAVAWGNTNTSPRDFSAALKCAEETQRRVSFVRWGQELPEVIA